MLVGAAKHGVSRTDYHILNDPELSFLDAHKNFAQNRGAGNTSSLNPLAVGFGQTPPVMSSAHIQDEKVLEQAEGKVEESENSTAKEKGEGKEEEEETDGSGKESKRECEAEASSAKNELKGVEVGIDAGSKSISEKGSEEDEEEKLEDDDKSEESSQPEGKASPLAPLPIPQQLVVRYVAFWQHGTCSFLFHEYLVYIFFHEGIVSSFAYTCVLPWHLIAPNHGILNNVNS